MNNLNLFQSGLLTARKLLLNAVVLLPLFAAQANAAPSDTVKNLQDEWAVAMYKSTGDAKEKSLEALAEKSRNAVANNPSDANVLVWEGIILASYAGARGGLGALGLVKESKAALESAIAIDGKAMDGSAYTSLGSLYYQVPGWPIGFGDDKKAEELLKQGLNINPNGIDPNYFYGDFLYRKGRYDEAEKALNKALSASPRAGRELADEGRKGEIRALLDKVKAKKG